jgi:hypothetical protein
MSLAQLRIAVAKIKGDNAADTLKALDLLPAVIRVTINGNGNKVRHGHNLSGDEFVKLLVDAGLANMKALTYLGFRYFGIHDKGAINIAAALPNLTALTELNISGNKIGPEGASKIAAALPSLTALTALYIGVNEIGPEGASKIADALSSLTALTTLYMRLNNICDEGASKIAAALPSLTALTTLVIDKNNICDEGALKVAQAVKKLATVETLFVSTVSVNAGSRGTPMYFKLCKLLADELSNEEKDMYDMELLAHWRSVRLRSQFDQIKSDMAVSAG